MPPGSQSGAPGAAIGLAQILLEPTKDRERFDATLLMLRSATSGEVRKVLTQALEREFVEPLSEAIGGGREGRARALAILAVLAGFDTVDSVLGIDVLGEPSGRQLLLRLEACVD